jgi:hypothetical protein
MIIPRANWMNRLAAPVRGLGPYAAIELLLPGGSLIALSLWAIRHRAWIATRLRDGLAPLSGLVSVTERKRAALVAGRSQHALDLAPPAATCTTRN